jgi:endonuclease YncB( thermonuclease family)
MSSNDKYGRYLTKIYTDSTEAQSVSDILIAEGLAYAYDGKTKKKFEEWYEAAE